MKKKESILKESLKIFNTETIYYLSLLTQIGLTLVFSIGIALYLYTVYKNNFGESILVLFLFLLFGIISGFYNTYKLILKKDLNDKNNKK